jgi:hypothetical protein
MVYQLVFTITMSISKYLVLPVDLYIHSPIHLHGVVFNQLSTGTTLPLSVRPFNCLYRICEVSLQAFFKRKINDFKIILTQKNANL